MKPSSEEWHQVLSYDPVTGAFTWKSIPGNNRWNKKFAGKRAEHTCAIYARIYYKGRLYQAHSVAWCMMTGSYPVGILDHDNGEKQDNRFANLVDATTTQNNRNKAMQKRNTSGVTGVHWQKALCKWVAQIRDGRRLIHLGTFSDINVAAAARKRAEAEFGYHPNHGRPAA